MEFELGQIFGGRYPPEVARWCELHSARMVKDGASNWRIEAIPPPADEELQSSKLEELQPALAAADWRSMREHDRRATDPTYQTDPTVFAYKQCQLQNSHPQIQGQYSDADGRLNRSLSAETGKTIANMPL